MPIHSRERNGRKEYRWGEHGTWYEDRAEAVKQAQAAYSNGYTGDDIAEDNRLIVLDATMRSYDKDGRLHIARSHISKSCVNPYYGREIPRWQALGLDPYRIYMMLRDPEELSKAAPTFARLPILAKHTPIGTEWDDVKRKEYIVGTVGSDVEFLEPYLDADVAIWDADAIAGIETDQIREFSCGYSYEPIMTTGKYNGEKYDGIMTQIQGNHLALVESGRAGPDVLAADSTIEGNSMIRTKLGNALIIAVTTAFPKVKIAADSELEKALGGVRKKTFGKTEREAAGKLILAMDSAIDSKQVYAVMDALSDVDDPEPTKKENEEPESAKDCTCGAKDGKHTHDCKMDKKAKDAAAEKADKEEKAANDKKVKDEAEKNEKAMDAKLDALRAEFRDADQAKRDVRPVVGDVVAMDSAEKIYEFALDQMKVDHTGVTGTPALRALFNLAKERQSSGAKPVAMDAGSSIKRFSNLGRFRQG